MGPFLTLISRDLGLAVREGGALGTVLGFNLIVVSLMPLGLGPDLNLLSRIAPGVLWIALLLSALLSLPRVFEADFEDGSLEALALGSMPLGLVAAAKCAAHWIATAVPLCLLAPLLGLLLNLDVTLLPLLVATLLIGTPAVSFLGGIGAALTLRSRRGGVLIALLVLPLYVPTLIFGISAIDGGGLGTGGAAPSLMILGAISLAAIVLGPLATGAALKAHLS